MEDILRVEELAINMPWAGFEDIYRILRSENGERALELDLNRFSYFKRFVSIRNDESVNCPACGKTHYSAECEVEYESGTLIYKTPCGATLLVEEKEVFLCPVCFETSENYRYYFDENDLKVKLDCGHLLSDRVLFQNSFTQKRVKLLRKDNHG